MRFYRALLHFFPRSFRAEYGAEMVKDFTRDWRQASGSRVAVIWRATLDVLTNALRVHADILQQDLRYSLRSLRRTPGFTVTAILVAAIGIGATTATFSIADHVLLRPLPFHEPDRLVRIWESDAARPAARVEPSAPNYHDWRRLAQSFDAIEAFTGASATIAGVGDVERIAGTRVTGGLMRMLGRHAALGRILTESDANDASNVLVISDGFWRGGLAADPDVVGRTIIVDNSAHVIVGVMPADFHFPNRGRHFWRPMRVTSEDRTNNYLEVLARLAPGQSFEQARSEMRLIGEQLRSQFPAELAGIGVRIGAWREEVGAQTRLLIWALAGAASCILLIACTNLANLLMARALSRRAELSMRAALGASVDRLARQAFTDSWPIALCGGAIGVVIAATAAPLLMRLAPSDLPISELPPLDLRMLVRVVAITVLTAIAFGMIPALRVSRDVDSAALKETGRSVTRGSERLRSALVVGEIAMSVVLLVSAGLLFQALMKVRAVDPGFSAENVLTVRTTLPRAAYRRTEDRQAFYSRVIADVERLPGVRRAAYVSFLPMVTGGGIQDVLSTTPDSTNQDKFKPIDLVVKRPASLRFVTPGYFATIGLPLIRGRDVAATDTSQSPFVAIVSSSFVHRYVPAAEPIGHQFGFGYEVRTIVGVVEDIRVRGLERESEPQVYLPQTQAIAGTLEFYVPQDLAISASVPAATLAAPVRSIIRAIDPALIVSNVRLLTDVIDAQTESRRLQVTLAMSFAGAACLLAALGIHGLLAYSVSARTREIGIRIALGAERSTIMNLVLGRSLRLAAAGVAVGVPIAYAAGRSIEALLFGVDPANPSVLAIIAVVVLVMAAAGSVSPAWRAIRVDPITATRSE